MKSSFALVSVFLISFAQFSSQNLAGQNVVKDGFYKISSLKDGSVLTATRDGPRPHNVYTEKWQNLPVQHWKVKSKTQEGLPLQIIRNEQIRDNEVTKESSGDSSPSSRDFVPLDWNLVKDPSGRANTYIAFNGEGCLTGFGVHQRISIAQSCDEEAPTEEQLWHLEFLYSIPK